MVSRRAAREFADDVLQEARRREEGLAQEQAVPPWRESRVDARRSFRESVLRLVREWCAARRGSL
jgi:hypothetical protein